MTALQVQASVRLFKIVLRRWLVSLLLDFGKLRAASYLPLDADFAQANTRTACTAATAVQSNLMQKKPCSLQSSHGRGQCSRFVIILNCIINLTPSILA